MKALLLIALIAPAAMADVRVEPRQFVKEEHFFFSGGLTWLNRNDYYVSPGGILSAQYYFSESNGPSSRTRCSSIRARRRCGPKRSRRWRRSPACCRRCRRGRYQRRPHRRAAHQHARLSFQLGALFAAGHQRAQRAGGRGREPHAAERARAGRPAIRRRRRRWPRACARRRCSGASPIST